MRKLEKIVLILLVSNEMPARTFGWTHPSSVGGLKTSSYYRTRRSFLKPSFRNSQSSDTIAENEVSNDTSSFPGIDSARELYPHWNVLFNGTLQVDSTHTLSFQILGKPKEAKQEDGLTDTMPQSKKLAALFLHGGPGAGCFPNHARFFDPERYHRVVLLDQRGCGRSTPTGCLTDNTLQDLVEDCERLKQHLQIPHWDVVLGGSWGTTVAIAYGQSYPESVCSIILRGVFLFRPQEIDWLFSSKGGAAQKYPAIFQSFREAVGILHNLDGSDCDEVEYSPLVALHEHTRRLWEAPTEEERSKAAQSWMQWEFFNSVAHKIPPSTNLSDSNATMQAIQAWKSPDVPPVAVAIKDQVNEESENVWNYQSLDQRVIPQEILCEDLANVISDTMIQSKFRRDISNGYSIDDPPRETVQIRPTIPYYVGTGSTYHAQANTAARTNNLPIQAMLTSFYSSNCDYCRNGLNLLDPERMRQLEKIPTIIVQGGSDGICPPDSALDLFDAWPTNGAVELRMPVYGGHSMYDPLVRNELLWATDRMADAL